MRADTATRTLWLGVGAAAVAVAVALAAPSRETNAAVAPDASSTAGASAACSRATARAAMAREQLLSDPQLGLRAVGQVFCGAFAGPGSRGMAVSAAHGVCMPYAGWGAFRYVNGDWKLIPGGSHPGILDLGIARTGNDILEKKPIRYPGETVCTASGRKERAWHWNGSRLVAGPWKVTSTGPTVVQHVSFLSPDRKVGCSATGGVWCMTIPYANGAHLASMTRAGSVTICNVTPADICAQNIPTRRGAPVLLRGQRNELGGIRCTGESRGLTCVVMAGAGKGKGFLINAAGVTKVG